MITEQIENRLMKIIEKTKNMQLDWRPIDEYVKYFNDNPEISEKVMMFRANEYVEFYENKSFFCIQNDSYLFLLNYKNVSAIDGSSTIECELFGSLHHKSPIYSIPPYLDGGIETLQKSIHEYWELKKGMYSPQVSDIFSILDKFGD